MDSVMQSFLIKGNSDSITEDTKSEQEPLNVSSQTGDNNNPFIRIDTIKFSYLGYCIDFDEYMGYTIPKAVAINPEYQIVADSINKYIIELTEYHPENNYIDTNWCRGINFQYEFKSNYLLLNNAMVVFCAHGEVESHYSQLFDLNTGNCIEQHEIPFSALFSIKGYFDFLNSRNWSENMRKAFEEEFRRMNEDDDDPMDEKKLQEEIDEECNYAKFHICYSFDKNEFRFARESNYYAAMAWALRCYEPEYSDHLPLKDLEPYLNDIGKQLLSEKYLNLSSIERILLKNKLWSQIEDYMFFELNDAENLSVALNYQDHKNVWGYIYGKDKTATDIKGVFENGVLTLKTSNDSVFTIYIKAFKEYSWGKDQIVGYSDKNEPY